MARIGLVLGAGGRVGQAYHAGVLAALEHDFGWDPRSADVIVGTSAGSITGSLLRLGVPAHDFATTMMPAGAVDLREHVDGLRVRSGWRSGDGGCVHPLLGAPPARTRAAAPTAGGASKWRAVPPDHASRTILFREPGAAP